MSAVTHDHHGSTRGTTRAGKLVKLGGPVRSRPSDPTAHLLRAVLDTRLRALLSHDPGTRVGEDSEELHQMRVAVRRMRATLKAARPLLERTWADDLRAELGWLGRALGPVRDADVLIERLRSRAAAFDQGNREAVETLIEALVADRKTARAEMLAVLGSRRYTALLRRLATAVSRPLPTPPLPRCGSPDGRASVHRVPQVVQGGASRWRGPTRRGAACPANPGQTAALHG
jgi:CHAD domain-containing protein